MHTPLCARRLCSRRAGAAAVQPLGLRVRVRRAGGAAVRGLHLLDAVARVLALQPGAPVVGRAAAGRPVHRHGQGAGARCAASPLSPLACPGAASVPQPTARVQKSLNSSRERPACSVAGAGVRQRRGRDGRLHRAGAGKLHRRGQHPGASLPLWPQGGSGREGDGFAAHAASSRQAGRRRGMSLRFACLRDVRHTGRRQTPPRRATRPVWPSPSALPGCSKPATAR